MRNTMRIQPFGHVIREEFPSSVSPETLNLAVKLSLNIVDEPPYPLSCMGLLLQEVYPHIPCGIINEGKDIAVLLTNGRNLNGTHEI
jgi:hypothetical protein